MGDSQSIAIPGREGEYLELSKTPGGSIYGTTPGGTKKMYSTSELLFLGSSPICRTPPEGMATIPGITSQDRAPTPPKSGQIKENSSEERQPIKIQKMMNCS